LESWRADMVIVSYREKILVKYKRNWSCQLKPEIRHAFLIMRKNMCWQEHLKWC